MKWTSAGLLWMAMLPGLAQAECAIPGKRVQWIADLCMAQLQTDDEIVASACIDAELARPATDECAALRTLKRRWCAQVEPQALGRCIDDPQSVGNRVRNNGG